MKQVKEMKLLVPVFVPEYPYAYFLFKQPYKTQLIIFALPHHLLPYYEE